MARKFTKIAVFMLVLALMLSFAGALAAQPDTYELTSQDKVILTQPSVCFITSYFWGYVLDPWENTWSDPYYWAFVGTGFCVFERSMVCLQYSDQPVGRGGWSLLVHVARV